MDNKGNVVTNVVSKKIKSKFLMLLLGGGCGSTFFLLMLIFPLFIAILIVLGILGGDNNNSLANSGYTTNCDNQAAEFIAKLVFYEESVGDFFTKLTTAAIAINNAGGTSYSDMLTLTKNKYSTINSIKNHNLKDVVPEKSRGEYYYIAELVLSGKYNLPKNMIFQTGVSTTVPKYGTLWTSLKTGKTTTYFGYSGKNGMASTTITGEELPSEAYGSNSLQYYKNLAKSLELSDYSSYTLSSVCSVSENECSSNISSTSLSKNQFKSSLMSYSSKISSSKKSSYQVFVNNSDNIYDIAVSNNVNPEVVVSRAIREGFSPGTKNNYWGIGCTNTGGLSACSSFSSFSKGVSSFVDNIKKYSSMTDMMSKYSYIGEYWYNPGSAGVGGCYYLNYIYDTVPDRLKSACGSAAPECSVGKTSKCVKTTSDDQTAYAKWQVDEMEKLRENIFGINDCTKNYSSDVKNIISWGDAEAWQALTGTSTNYKSVSKSTMDSRVTTISVPIRMWSTSAANDKSTKKVMKNITVNKALAPMFTAFFNDIYNEATDFVFVSLYCYSYRNSVSGNTLSAHAYGAACDINSGTLGNKYGGKIYSKSEWNTLKDSKSKYQIIYTDSKIVQIAHRYTLSWGGEWNSNKDGMHFSFIRDESRKYLINRK